MPNTEHPLRKRQRLHGFDYGAGYAYFVTLCTHSRQALFGVVNQAGFNANAAGMMVARLWEEMPSAYPGVVLDVFAVMPDHFHATLGLISPNVALGMPVGGPAQGPAPTESSARHVPAVPNRGLLLPEVIQRFKSLTTHEYGALVKQGISPPYASHLWQRGYYERVLRSDADLEAHREYVYQNAFAWSLEHPVR